MKKLSEMNKEEKLQFLEALKEKKRRLKKKKPQYKPHPGQLKVHACDKKNRFCFAANSFGKSCLSVQEAVAAAKGYNPWLKKYTHVPARVIVVLDRPDKVADVWLREAEKWYDTSEWILEKQGKPYITKITLPNGSSIAFMFALMDPLAFESIEVDFVVIDEPVPRKIWVALQRGGRTKGREARYLFIGTPITAPWLRVDIYDKWLKGELPNTECFRGSSEDNSANLQEGFLEAFASQLTDKEKKVRMRGEFFDLEDLALAHIFKEDVHVIPKSLFDNIFDKNRYPCVLSIDPHSSKPHHMALLGANDDNELFYIKEHRAKEVPRRFAQTIKEFIDGYRVVDIVYDSSGEAEGTGGEGYKSFGQVLKEEGVACRATSFKDKSDSDFIQRIREVLAIPETPNNFGMYTPKLRIIEGNEGIIKDISNVGWQKYRDVDVLKPKLEIRERDYLACLKYGLASGLSAKKGRERIHRPARTTAAYGFGKRRR